MVFVFTFVLTFPVNAKEMPLHSTIFPNLGNLSVFAINCFNM